MQPLIYHNPACGTSRNTLAMIEASGEVPEIIEYLKTPPSRERLVELLALMGISPRELLRRKGTPYDDLGLDDPSLSDDQLIEAMVAHAVLINRPIVVTSKGARCVAPPNWCSSCWSIRSSTSPRKMVRSFITQQHCDDLTPT